MFAKMHTLLKGRDGKFQIPGKVRLPILSAAEQAMLTWAVFIESYDSVPDIYKSFFYPLVANGQPFPYTVLTPAFSTSLHQITEKLVCTFDHAVHILERLENTWVEQCYPFDGISCVTMKTVLLESRVKISGMTKQGIPASSIMRFNMVTDFLLLPIIREVRLNAVDSTNEAQNSELEKFDLWAVSNYKFMNFARYSLLGVEKVVHTILQPEIRANRFKFFGITLNRAVSPTHVVILTNRELIMIQEEVVARDDVKYGATWDYIPLDKIIGLLLSRKDENLLTLSVQLPENESGKRASGLSVSSFREGGDRSIVGAIRELEVQLKT